MFNNLNFISNWSCYLEGTDPKEGQSGDFRLQIYAPDHYLVANVYLQREMRIIDFRSVYGPQIDFTDNSLSEFKSVLPL